MATAVLGLIVGSTALFTFTMDPVFEAVTKIVIEKENPNVVSIEGSLCHGRSGLRLFPDPV
jgi:uncharacterized protein involved in exopolysaccharide biosynthesis